MSIKEDLKRIHNDDKFKIKKHETINQNETLSNFRKWKQKLGIMDNDFSLTQKKIIYPLYVGKLYNHSFEDVTKAIYEIFYYSDERRTI